MKQFPIEKSKGLLSVKEMAQTLERASAACRGTAALRLEGDEEIEDAAALRIAFPCLRVSQYNLSSLITPSL
jgi:hypothetical protein